MSPRARPVSHIFDRVAGEFRMTREMLLDKLGKEPVRSIRLLAIIVTIDTMQGENFNLSAVAAAIGCDPSSVSTARMSARDRINTTPWFAEQHRRLVKKMREELGIQNGTVQLPEFGASSTPLPGGDHESIR
jgi:hypothetical protein